MQPDATESTIPAGTSSGRDAATAGWALSVVTCLVLAVGVLVIRSTQSESGDAHADAHSDASAPEAPEPRVEPIILQGSSPTSPTLLPAPETADSRPAAQPPRPATADRYSTSSNGRR